MPRPPLSDLLRSHAELRAAVILAGKELRKLHFGKQTNPVLSILRRYIARFQGSGKAVTGRWVIEWRGLVALAWWGF
jgi:hypothetical protein